MTAPDYPGHELFLPYLLNKTVALLNVHLQRMLDQQGLTLTHWRTLAFLTSQDGLTIGALAEATMTEASTLSRSLRALEERGYVARRTCEDDSRAMKVVLSRAGRLAFTKMLDKALTIEAGFLEGISTKEVEALRGLLLKMIANGQEPRRA
jgi:DNA-binding MarR family transcriptional regulator